MPPSTMNETAVMATLSPSSSRRPWATTAISAAPTTATATDHRNDQLETAAPNPATAIMAITPTTAIAATT